MNLPSSDLASLMPFIAERYVFDSKSYPGFDDLSPAQQRLFMVNHSVLHMNKSLGRIAGEVEAADHGDLIKHEELIVATMKMVVNSLRLAEALGLSPDEVAKRVPKVMRSQ